jgi:lysine 2,3-aminomutase
MVSGIEDLRTPLAEIIDFDVQLRGTLSGFMMPAFVVDLPGGGGKRLVSTYKKHNAATGVYMYTAPGLEGEKGAKEYFYHDPKPVQARALEELRRQQHRALEQGVSLQELTRSPLRTPPRPKTSSPEPWVSQVSSFPEATQSACSSR